MRTFYGIFSRPENGGKMIVSFSSLRNKDTELHLQMGTDGEVTLRCDNMDLCGDLIQNLAEYLALDDLRFDSYHFLATEKFRTKFEIYKGRPVIFRRRLTIWKTYYRRPRSCRA